MDVHIPCPCPGTPHPDGDTVTLRDKPSLHLGTTALGWASQQAQSQAPTSGDIAELYLREGILAWTLVLDDGSPRLLDDDGIQFLLDDYTVSYPIAEAASGLYTDLIFDPLVRQVEGRNSSRTSRTGESTSAKSRPSRSRPTPS